MKTIDIIIPVYFAPELTIRCIQSVCKNTDFSQNDVKIIVVDDSGSPAFSQLLDRSLIQLGIRDQVEVLTHEKNAGFIEACYTGIGFRKAEYKLLLNSDTFVTEGWLETMLETAESSEEISIVNPVTNNIAVIDVPMPEGFNINLMRRFVQQLQYTNQDFLDIVTSAGFCMMIKTRDIDKYGFFDRIFGIGYGEETDLHFRFVSKGLRAVISPNSFVYHRGEASFSDRDARVAKNREIFLERWEKDYHRDIHPFMEKTVLNRFRSEIAAYKDLSVDYLFFSPTNQLSNQKAKLMHQLSNALNEESISASFTCKQLVDNGDKIEDRLYKPISFESLKKSSYKAQTIVYTSETANEAIEYAQKLHKATGVLPKLVFLPVGSENLPLTTVKQLLGVASNSVVNSPKHSHLVHIADQQIDIVAVKNAASLDFYGQHLKRKQKATSEQKRLTLHLTSHSEEISATIRKTLLELSRSLSTQLIVTVIGEELEPVLIPNIQIINLGEIDEVTLTKTLLETDIFVDTDPFQDLSIIAIEALFSGCLVLAPEQNREESCYSGIISYNVRDSVSLSQQIQQLLTKVTSFELDLNTIINLSFRSHQAQFASVDTMVKESKRMISIEQLIHTGKELPRIAPTKHVVVASLHDNNSQHVPSHKRILQKAASRMNQNGLLYRGLRKIFRIIMRFSNITFK